jgi:hypothetical protein
MGLILDISGVAAQPDARCYASRPMNASNRPDFAPENRSRNAGKFAAILVVAVLVLGALASLVVVMTRGSSGITPPPPKVPKAGAPAAGDAANQ